MVMASIYAKTDEYEKAIDELEYLLSIEAFCTPVFLLADPIFDPLETIPRIREVLKKYKGPGAIS